GTIMFFLLPESLQFLALRANSREKLARWIGRIAPGQQIDANTKFVVSEKKAKGVPILHLFRDGRAAGTILLWIINFMNLLNLYFLAGFLPTIVSKAYPGRTAQLVATALQVGGVIGTFAFSWLIARMGFIPVLGTAFFIATLTIAMIGQPALALTLLFVVVFIAGFCVVGGQGALNA